MSAAPFSHISPLCVVGSGRGGQDSWVILNNLEQSTHKPIHPLDIVENESESRKFASPGVWLGEQGHGPSPLLSVSGWMNANTTPSSRHQASASLVGSPLSLLGLVPGLVPGLVRGVMVTY